MKKSFQDKLRIQIRLYTTIIILVSLLLFIGSLFYYSHQVDAKKAKRFNEYLTNLFKDTYLEYEQYLEFTSKNEHYQDFILSGNNQNDIFNYFYKFNNNKRIKSNMIILDADGNVLLDTFKVSRKNQYFSSFNNIICQKILKSNKTNKIETGLYSFGQSSEFIMSSPVMKDEKIIGFVTFYLDENDWNYELSSQEHNGVITDSFGNVIATSSKMIVDEHGKFIPKMNKNKIEIMNNTYQIKWYKLEPYSINLYSIVESKVELDQYLIGIGIILVLGLSLFGLIQYLSQKIALQNSLSINKLVNEMEIIREENLRHKIELNTDDEIELIAESVNQLVERINELNMRNTELMNIKRISEIKQLEAQFNPHFLYNTLEVIRYSIMFDQNMASDLIGLLTKILRYSVDIDKDEVPFIQNLEYTKVFLKIHKYRFSNNFQYTIDVGDSCSQVVVPKLFLQPIIENSIKYGFKNKSTLAISIKARTENSFLIITVEDDGPGIGKDELEKLNNLLGQDENNTNHLGLYNIARRLRLQFSEDSCLYVESTLNKGTKVVLEIFIASSC